MKNLSNTMLLACGILLIILSVVIYQNQMLSRQIATMQKQDAEYQAQREKLYKT